MREPLSGSSPQSYGSETSPDSSPTSPQRPSTASNGQVRIQRSVSEISNSSNTSNGSRTSRISSLARRASQVGASLKSGLGRSSSLSRASIATTADVARLVALQPGDTCEVASLVTMRTGESLQSEVVSELAIGTTLKVTEVGEGRRIKVVCEKRHLEGWISSKTKLNEPLVIKHGSDMDVMIDGFEKGGRHEIKSIVTVREEESLESPVLCQLRAGTIVRILCVGDFNKRRAKIAAEGIEGWISVATVVNQELLLGKVTSDQEIGSPNSRASRASRSSTSSTVTFGGKASPSRLSSMGMTNQARSKKLLEAARSGDLTGVRKIVENKGSILDKGMGLLMSKPTLNCSDVRGKTALIYAAANGHRAIVEYLLTKPKEFVDANMTDDTQKTALHHAAKRRGYAQAEIVELLIQKQGNLEAPDHNMCTPLMFAAANGDEYVLRALLKAGANCNSHDVESHSPLDYALTFSQPVMAQILRDAGATEERRDNNDNQNDNVSEGYSDDDGSAEPEMDHPCSGSTSPSHLDPAKVLGAHHAARMHARQVAAERDAEAAAAGAEDEEASDVESVEEASRLAAEAAAAAAAQDEAEADAKPKKKKKSAKVSEDAGEFNPPPREDAAEGEVAEVKKKKKKSLKTAEAAEGEEPGQAAAGEEPKETEKAKKPKGEKKPASKKKDKKNQEMMMEAVAGTDDADKEIDVQDEDKVASSKERALEKLEAVAKVTDSAAELEEAIKAAEAAGATDEDLANARARLKKVKAQAKAQVQLRKAIKHKDAEELQAAIAKAREQKVNETLIQDAEAVLAELGDAGAAASSSRKEQ